MLANRMVTAVGLVLAMFGISALGGDALGATGDDGQPALAAVSSDAEPNSEVVKNKDVALQVQLVVEPPKRPLQIKDSFAVRLQVVNKSDTVQSFHVMNCSWFDHWKSSNAHVAIIGWPCSKNFSVLETLRPNEAYEKSLSMQVLDGQVGQTVSFKMGFTPIDSKRTYWSQEIKVQVGSQDLKR